VVNNFSLLFPDTKISSLRKNIKTSQYDQLSVNCYTTKVCRCIVYDSSNFHYRVICKLVLQQFFLFYIMCLAHWIKLVSDFKNLVTLHDLTKKVDRFTHFVNLTSFYAKIDRILTLILEAWLKICLPKLKTVV
jgi:hypothetical protein